MISEANNKAFGRFIELAMLNIGGYYVKENRMGTFGYMSPWTFAEDEEACLRVGWDPYHVTQGYDLNDNTLTAHAMYEEHLMGAAGEISVEYTDLFNTIDFNILFH